MILHQDTLLYLPAAYAQSVSVKTECTPLRPTSKGSSARVERPSMEFFLCGTKMVYFNSGGPETHKKMGFCATQKKFRRAPPGSLDPSA